MVNIKDVSVINNCDLSSTFEPINNLPSYIYPLTTTALVLIPIIMLTILIIQFVSFWTSGCCARNCSSCCIPFSLCAALQLVIGIIPTFLGFFIIFCKIFYEQGDDALDTVLKKITTSDRIIEFGVVNMSSFTKGVIGPFRLETIKLQKIEFVKNLIDAKLETPVSEILSFYQLPFNRIGDMINKTLTNAAESIHLDKIIVDPIDKAIDSAFEYLPDLKLDEIVNTDQMKLQLFDINSSIKCCNSEFNSLYKGYIDFFEKFNQKIKIYAEKRNSVDSNLRKVPVGLAKFGNDLFGGILKALGSTFSKAFKKITVLCDGFKLNIVRVRFLHKFMSAMMCLSIAAHLYLFGMAAMTMLLWYRRRGMGKNNAYEEFDTESMTSVIDSDESRKLGKYDDSSLFSQLIE